jgi:hypothetical protein
MEKFEKSNQTNESKKTNEIMMQPPDKKHEKCCEKSWINRYKLRSRKTTDPKNKKVINSKKSPKSNKQK